MKLDKVVVPFQYTMIGVIQMRIDVDQLMKADTLVYKHTQTNLEKNMELYCKYGVFALATQNGKFVGSAMLLGTTKLNKKSFKGLKTSLFKKDVNVQLYFVRPTFIINNCTLDESFTVVNKKVRFKGTVNAKIELAHAEKFVNFVKEFSANKSGVIVTEADFAGFLIATALNEMAAKGELRTFKYENNAHGGRTHESYLGNLAFRVYFADDKINRYGAVGLRARSIQVEAKEVSY